MKKWIMAALVMLFYSLLTSNAMAIGLGFKITGGSGESDWNYDSLFQDTTGTYSSEGDFSSDDSYSGFGFVFDTNLAKDKLFNYRLEIGFEDKEYKTKGGGKIELDGIHIINDFGFGIIRSENLRLWIGPELKLTQLSDEDNSWDSNMDIMEFSYGPVIGLNFNPGNLLTVAMKTGYLFSQFTGDSYYYTTDSSLDNDYDGDGSSYFFTLALIFRINDNYSN